MGFTERLRILIDVVSDKATAGLVGFRQSVAQADGFAGKLRAGVSSLGATFGSFIKSPMGAATAVTGAAVAMAKAVTAASDLALEVGKLADATGLSADAASRWIEVGKDMGIGGDQIASMLTKLTATLGKTPEKFAELGVAVQYAADGSVDMQATLLNAIDVLNKTTDPTKRAALAQQLFGKSWKEAAELIGAGAVKVKEKLDDVNGAKLIDQKEIEQARKFRETMDQLKDVGEDLAITVGQSLIPVLNAVVPVLSDIAGGVKDVTDAVTWLVNDFEALSDALSPGDFELNIEALKDFKEKLNQADKATVELGDASKEAHIQLKQLEAAERGTGEAAANLARDIESATRAQQDFLGELDKEEKLERFTELLEAAREELEDTDAVSGDTGRAIVRAFDDAVTALTGFNLLADKAVKIAVDTGDLERAEAIMLRIQQAAAAGATFNIVTQNYEGGTADTFARRAIRDALNTLERNGG